MGTISVTTTGVEIQPYEKRQCKLIEYQTSYLEKNRHTIVPVSGFFNSEDESFLTYKMPIEKLRNMFPTYDVVKRSSSPSRHFGPVIIPTNFELRPEQRDIFNDMMTCSQTEMFVNIPTATGKTVMGVYYISMKRVVTLISCPTSKILDQWINTAMDMGFDSSRFKVIGNSELLNQMYDNPKNFNYDIYFIKPALMTIYGNKHGFGKLGHIFSNLGIGIKIIDEAHLNMGATIRLNAVTSIAQTVYMSADFYKASYFVRDQFMKVFGNVHLIRLPDDTLVELKHITAVMCEFDSMPDTLDMLSVTAKNKYAWNHWAYARYEFEKGEIINYIKEILNGIVSKSKPSENGYYKILILVQLKEHVDLLYGILQNEYGDVRNVGRYHSDVPPEEQEGCLSKDIIISTYKAFSTGVNVVSPEIQHVISTSPVDVVTHNQAAGRCRPIPNTHSYYWILEDIAFEFCKSNINKTASYLRNSRVKDIIKMEKK